MDPIVGVISLDSPTGLARCQIARGIALPVLALAAHRADFDTAMTLVERAEGRARLVDHQNIARCQKIAAVRQPCSRLAIVPAVIADPLSRFSAAIPDSAAPLTS